MKKRIGSLLLSLSLLLSGCGWMQGSYVSVTPHEEPRQTNEISVITAKDYRDLMLALEEMIASGVESAAINVAEYPADAVESGMAVAIRHAMDTYPIGAYAVEGIVYEMGTSGGQPAVAVTITYRHTLAEIFRIRRVENIAGAEKIISETMDTYEPGVVLLIEDYVTRDFTQMVNQYAVNHPQTVMELPQVRVGIYGSGKARVVELEFSYQTSRDSLRQMQMQVKPVFEAAELYVSGSGSERQKYSQLYAFLMERFDYTLATSVTPAYSLLCDGVGDSEAFAIVYAAMCQGAGLECMVVSGIRDGVPWYWNIVKSNGYYYHVDLLKSSTLGGYREFVDGEMKGYVWDPAAYPGCTGPSVVEQPAPSLNIPDTEPAPETLPEETAEEAKNSELP